MTVICCYYGNNNQYTKYCNDDQTCHVGDTCLNQRCDDIPKNNEWQWTLIGSLFWLFIISFCIYRCIKKRRQNQANRRLIITTEETLVKTNVDQAYVMPVNQQQRHPPSNPQPVLQTYQQPYVPNNAPSYVPPSIAVNVYQHQNNVYPQQQANYPPQMNNDIYAQKANYQQQNDIQQQQMNNNYQQQPYQQPPQQNYNYPSR